MHINSYADIKIEEEEAWVPLKKKKKSLGSNFENKKETKVWTSITAIQIFKKKKIGLKMVQLFELRRLKILTFN